MISCELLSNDTTNFAVYNTVTRVPDLMGDALYRGDYSAFLKPPETFVCCRIIWITIVLTSTSIFVYQCQDLVRLYLSRPVRMTITMSRQGPVVFPAVTICNQNAFRYHVSLFVWCLLFTKKYFYAPIT